MSAGFAFGVVFAVVFGTSWRRKDPILIGACAGLLAFAVFAQWFDEEPLSILGSEIKVLALFVIGTAAVFWRAHHPGTPQEQKEAALAEIERCRLSLADILAVGMIDPGYDAERVRLEKVLKDLSESLRGEIRYATWWRDRERALAAQRAEKRASAAKPHAAPTGRYEAPVNKKPVNQEALRWLREAREPADSADLYLTQLAYWGAERGVQVHGWSLEPQDVQNRLNSLLTNQHMNAGDWAAKVYDWLTTNPDGPDDQSEQEGTLLRLLKAAQNPMEAAAAVLETVSDRMEGGSATSEE